MSDRWTDRLSEYLDGELTTQEQIALEAHLEDCDSCRRTLEELRAVLARTAALVADEPRNDLWEQVRRRIEADNAPAVLPFTPRPAAARRRRIAFSLPQLAAAAVVLMFVSGGSVWIALRGESERPGSPFAQQPLDSGLVRTVSNGGSVDVNAETTVADLERLLAENRDKLDPVTIAVLESNLRIIDAAITEARAALQRDPGNPYLSEHLGNTIDKKIDVLRRAAAIGRTEI